MDSDLSPSCKFRTKGVSQVRRGAGSVPGLHLFSTVQGKGVLSVYVCVGCVCVCMCVWGAGGWEVTMGPRLRSRIPRTAPQVQSFAHCLWQRPLTSTHGGGWGAQSGGGAWKRSSSRSVYRRDLAHPGGVWGDDLCELEGLGHP